MIRASDAACSLVCNFPLEMRPIQQHIKNDCRDSGQIALITGGAEMADSDKEYTKPSTTGSGAPAVSDRHSLTIGPDGPILLHDVHFLEQMAHFNREKVPERQPHAKGGGAFGVFETTEDVSAYTKAALFQKGEKTDLLIRFSTVAGEQGSPDTWRDVRGFSLKFYTQI